LDWYLKDRALDPPREGAIDAAHAFELVFDRLRLDGSAEDLAQVSSQLITERRLLLGLRFDLEALAHV